MNQRLRVLVLAGALLLGQDLLFALGAGERAAGGLVGTVVTPPMPSVDFTLTDQHGSPFRLNSTRGRVAVITFIYTSCTDVCSFMAVKMRRAYELLGEHAKEVSFVAVTTDPTRDTIEVIARYSRELGMYDKWSFVTGSNDELAQVWSQWRVGVQTEKAHSHSEESEEAHHHAATDADLSPSHGLRAADIELAGKLIGAFGGGYEVAHTAPFWLLDRKGMIRALLDAEALPQDIVRDVRALLRE